MNNFKRLRPTEGVIVKASYEAYNNTGFFTVYDLENENVIIKKFFDDFEGSANLLFLIGICEYLRHCNQTGVILKKVYCANSTAHSWAKTRRCKSAYVAGKFKSYVEESLSFLNSVDFCEYIILWEKSWGKWRPTPSWFTDEAPF